MTDTDDYAGAPNPGTITTPIDAAAVESDQTKGSPELLSVTVLGRDFNLAPSLSLAATYGLDKSQREESLSGLVDAFAKIIHRDDRDAFLEYVLSDPEVDGKELSTEDFFDVFSDAITKVTGRPLDTTGS